MTIDTSVGVSNTSGYSFTGGDPTSTGGIVGIGDGITAYTPMTGGGKKSVDDYYETVYELSVESGLWDNIRDFIEPQSMVNSRKLKAIQAQKAKEQPQMDLSKLQMNQPGLTASEIAETGNNENNEFNPRGLMGYGGKRKTKTIKSRKPSTNKSLKKRYATKTLQMKIRKGSKKSNRSKKNKTRRKRHY